jgi:hypothetical protein
VSDAHGLGKVDNIWAVASSSNTFTGLSLKARAKKRIEESGKPSVSSFEEYQAWRSSYWLVEERDHDYFCDCPISMKGKLCKHTNGLYYREGKMEVTSQVRSVPIGQKRKRGRPKKLPNCLTRSPPLQENSQNQDQDLPSLMPSQADPLPSSPSRAISPEPISPFPLRRSKRKVATSAGLSNQAPPKKKCRTKK